MTMAEFVHVARLDDLPPGASTVVTVAGMDVALFNVDGTVHAMEDACAHQGSSLGSSRLDGGVVTCLGHGWRYNVATGKLVDVPTYGVMAFPVQVVDGWIAVALP